MGENGGVGGLGSFRKVHHAICIASIPYSFYVRYYLSQGLYIRRVNVFEIYFLFIIVQVNETVVYTVVHSMILIIQYFTLFTYFLQ